MTTAEALQLLELRPGATPDEAKKAYRTLCKVWHPDRFTDPELRKLAGERQQQLNEAYSLLCSSPNSPNWPPCQQSQGSEQQAAPPEPPPNPNHPSSPETGPVGHDQRDRRAGGQQDAARKLSLDKSLRSLWHDDYVIAFACLGVVVLLAALPNFTQSTRQNGALPEQLSPTSAPTAATAEATPEGDSRPLEPDTTGAEIAAGDGRAVAIPSRRSVGSPLDESASSLWAARGQTAARTELLLRPSKTTMAAVPVAAKANEPSNLPGGNPRGSLPALPLPAPTVRDSAETPLVKDTHDEREAELELYYNSPLPAGLVDLRCDSALLDLVRFASGERTAGVVVKRSLPIASGRRLIEIRVLDSQGGLVGEQTFYTYFPPGTRWVLKVHQPTTASAADISLMRLAESE